MGRDNSGKIIAVIALLIAVAGLSVGFAAYSTRLDIASSADVNLDADVWDVGFSTVNSAITPGTVNGQTNSANNGTLALTQFSITQGTNATLATTNGSSVVYNFYIVNNGKLDAYMNEVTMGSLTCAYATTNRTEDDGHTTVTAGSGTISNADCATLFTAKLTVDSEDFVAGSTKTSGFGNDHKLAKPSSGVTYVPATLTISYNNNSISSVSVAPNADFTVSLGTSNVIYGTSSN